MSKICKIWITFNILLFDSFSHYYCILSVEYFSLKEMMSDHQCRQVNLQKKKLRLHQLTEFILHQLSTVIYIILIKEMPSDLPCRCQVPQRDDMLRKHQATVSINCQRLYI